MGVRRGVSRRTQAKYRAVSITVMVVSLFLLALASGAMSPVAPSQGDFGVGRSLLDADSGDSKECGNPSSYSDPCAYVKESCEGVGEGILDYMQLAFCHGHPVGLAWFIISLEMIVMVALMVFLGFVTDEYFTPVMETITNRLGLSDNLAGVTFLALGNGAPDILTSFASLNQGSPGLTLGAQFGAALFITTLIPAAVALSQEYRYNKWPLARDTVFLAIAAIAMVVIIASGRINLFESVFIVGLYVVYVGVVVAPDLLKKKSKKPHTHGKHGLHPQPDGHLHLHHDPEFTGDISRLRSPTVAGAPSNSSGIMAEDATVNSHPGSDSDDSEDERKFSDLATGDVEQAATETTSLLSKSQHDLNTAGIPSGVSGHVIGHRYFRRVSSALMSAAAMPFVAMAAATTPQVDPERWSRRNTAISVGIGPVFFMWSAGLIGTSVGPLPSWTIGLTVGLVAAVVLWLTTTEKSPPRYMGLLTVWAFVMAVAWMNLLAGEVVVLLQVIGSVAGISQAILGLTVLAAGNCVGDFVADMAMARAGRPQMAVAATIGGPLLNILLGLGFGTMYVCITVEDPFALPELTTIFLSLGTLIFTILLSWGVFAWNGYKSSRWFAYVLIAIYAAFMVVGVGLELAHVV